MDLTTVSLLFSILAFLVSILVFWDNRNKTKIMKNQLGLMQEQTEGKQDIRDAIKTTGEVLKTIETINIRRYDWGDFGGVSYLRLLEKLHDSGESSIKWNVFFLQFLGDSLLKKFSFEQFRRLFEDKVSEAGRELTAMFSSEPKIEASPDVEVKVIPLKDYFSDLYSVRLIEERLKSAEKIVNLYDRSLIADIDELYLKVLKSISERIQNGTELVITRKTKTSSLPDLLLTIVAFDVWIQCVDELRGNIKQRLYDIRKQMLESI